MFVHDLNQFVTVQLLEEMPAVLSLAWALVKAAERAAHIQRVHDRMILSLSDNLSTVLCFNRGRPATSNS